MKTILEFFIHFILSQIICTKLHIEDRIEDNFQTEDKKFKLSDI